MAERSLDPSRLDVAALAAAGASLSGQWDASDLHRWHAMQTPAPGAELEPVQWRVRGEQRPVTGQPSQTWLRLHATAVAWLTCQRCLQAFSQALTVDRVLRFVDSEAQAEALDADSEDDVLALQPAPDLRSLVEDELLLAWPIVPRHAQCAVPEYSPGDSAVHGANPFAALTALKRPAAGG